MKVCCMTDIGVRREMNQDYFFTSEEPVGILPNLFIVADGMGGHNAGDFASRTVVETMSASVKESSEVKIADILTESVERANETLRECEVNHNELKGMGSTIVAAVLDDRTLIAANVGDSRLYIVCPKILRQVTTDHSLVHEMLMRGEIDEELARVHPDKNIITRAVGAANTVQVDTYEEHLLPGERILMCTDGMTNMVKDEEILEIMNGEEDLGRATEQLVKLANEHGGKDNITVITIDPEFER